MDFEAYVPPKFVSYRNLRTIGQTPESPNKLLKSLTRPHIAAFNSILESGLNNALAAIPAVHFKLPNGTHFSIKTLGGSLLPPCVPCVNSSSRDRRVFPMEARQSSRNYTGQLMVTFSYSVNGQVGGVLERALGQVPVMVMSDICNLSGLSPIELEERGEMASEFGGYFVSNGSEKLLRMQLCTRRNYPVCLKRSNYKTMGSLFSEYALQIRCFSPDCSVAINQLHYLNNGLCKLVFRYRRERFSVSPIVIIHALVDIVDKEIFRRLTRPTDSDHFRNYMACLIRDALYRGDDRRVLVGSLAMKQYLGGMYRSRLLQRLPDSASDEEVCDALLSDSVLIHLKSSEQKVDLLCFMVRKLYSFAYHQCCEESLDSPMLWEIQHGSHIFLQLLKQRLYSGLKQLHSPLMRRYSRNTSGYVLDEAEVVALLSFLRNVTVSLTSFVATGSLPETESPLCSDKAGLSTVAEKISYTRYMSHFRAVHRGNFFSTLRTTSVRQMLPDAWGFICPVHTPDGAPCGLLNHLTVNCRVSESFTDGQSVVDALLQLGVVPADGIQPNQQCYDVLLDGIVLGYIDKDRACHVVDRLRYLKCSGKIYQYLEVCLVPDSGTGSQFPGLFLFSADSRMMRPVINLTHKRIEYIGTFEQVYLNIAIRMSEIDAKDRSVYSHVELDDTCLLSSLALLVPLSDQNQSPRNMYQCQMSKQTMGTPLYHWPAMSDNKLYRLQTPHSPFFRPSHHDALGMDDFAQGTNAVVAVISYTGYDMEDAMIINKHSQERGMAVGFIYKARYVHLMPDKRLNKITSTFQRDDSSGEDLSPFLDSDGIPHVGIRLNQNSPIACHYNFEENKYHVERYQDSEPAYIDSVKLLGDINGVDMLQSILIVLRVERKPTVGDKFASRAGQKGICSRLYAAEDLPWTDGGLMPDIIFNPHGFPSRMTIAMMVECMAGKGASISGECFDASPFRFNEKQTSIDFFGSILEKAGYNYYGTETMYSGVTGEQLECRIFFGIIHYQRLRHMVSDKWQVRSTGPVDTITRQPIKGRKCGGGVRFGEMERDGVMAHGASLLVQDRLFNCSDKSRISLCKQCGSVLTPMIEMRRRAGSANEAGGARGGQSFSGRRPICSTCQTPRHVVTTHMPFTCLMLATQLAAMNVKIQFNVKSV